MTQTFTALETKQIFNSIITTSRLIAESSILANVLVRFAARNEVPHGKVAALENGLDEMSNTFDLVLKSLMDLSDSCETKIEADLGASVRQ